MMGRWVCWTLQTCVSRVFRERGANAYSVPCRIHPGLRDVPAANVASHIGRQHGSRHSNSSSVPPVAHPQRFGAASRALLPQADYRSRRNGGLHHPSTFHSSTFRSPSRRDPLRLNYPYLPTTLFPSFFPPFPERPRPSRPFNSNLPVPPLLAAQTPPPHSQPHLCLSLDRPPPLARFLRPPFPLLSHRNLASLRRRPPAHRFRDPITHPERILPASATPTVAWLPPGEQGR